MASQELLGCMVDDILVPQASDGDTVTLRPGRGVNVLAYARDQTDSTPTSATQLVPFRMDDSNTRRSKLKSNSVGRWQNLGEYNASQQEDSSAAMSRFSSVSQAGNLVELQPALVELVAEKRSPLFILFADSEHHQVMDTLNQHFPGSVKCGAIGASTPFINNQPFTLFDKQGTLSGGLVGVALTNPTIEAIALDHPCLEPVGGKLTIEKCRGNVILGLGGPDARQLESLLKNHTPAYKRKDLQLFVKVYSDDKSAGEGQEEDSARVYRLTGGDPAKMNMVLDGVDELSVGQQIQLYYAKDMASHPTRPVPAGRGSPLVVFQALDKEGETHHDDRAEDTSTTVKVPPATGTGDRGVVFGGASYNGFLFGKRAGECHVPYSSGSVTFTLEESTE
ncbi:hypothetical protein IWQ60_007127 [Tieghemiomyces parasiticus]|uniref:FIST domain-containing protein n=1 Tax=Tieghemiomyces parasiticus TaxID=78921 RepID=A0A9W8DV13_9FUNG|nr:hypothetical protein IWQ60_007127 [Tieghemiomyces parasiticus]